VYNFNFYAVLWSDKRLYVIKREKYRSSGEPCSEAKFSDEKVLARQARLHRDAGIPASRAEIFPSNREVDF